MLDRHPGIKRFVRTKEYADKFDGISIKFIPGHNPDLVLYGDGDTEVKRVDLTNIKGGKTPHVRDVDALLVSLGFKARMPQSQNGSS